VYHFGVLLIYYQLNTYPIWDKHSYLPNGLAYLPPDLAEQACAKVAFSDKWPPRTRAEGGQVEPVLGGLEHWSLW
jgi:hypothetical protein